MALDGGFEQWLEHVAGVDEDKFVANHAMQSEDQKAKSRRIYRMLAMLMTDESKPQKIVERAGRGQGGIAWFRLRAEYEPDTAGRQAGMLLRIMKTKFSLGSDLSEELTGLDLAIDKYETASTDVVTDSMKVGLVQLALADNFGELQNIF